MNLRIAALIIPAALLMGCQGDLKYKKLQAQNDSLEMIIRQDKIVAQSLLEMNSLISSVGLTGRPRRTNDDPEVTVNKMRAVTEYIRQCRRTIDSLESTVVSGRRKEATYSVAIQTLKNDLEIRENELTMMDEVVMLSLNQNDNLIHVVDLQRSEIDDKALRLKLQRYPSAVGYHAPLLLPAQQPAQLLLTSLDRRVRALH